MNCQVILNLHLKQVIGLFRFYGNLLTSLGYLFSIDRFDISYK